MDISHNHHHHISPASVIALLAVAGLIGLVQGGYMKGAFHKEILARLDPATVLTATGAVPQQRRAIMPANDGSAALSLH